MTVIHYPSSMLSTRFLAGFAVVSLMTAGIPLFSAHAATTVNPGDLIRGKTFSAVYYMGEDGFRYVFPNEKTYFTWYSNFSSVKMITDAELAKIQIGGNVTYHPGLKMVKINTDPKTYFVTKGGVLRWLPNETTATLVYGTNWNKNIDDIPDALFGNYSVGNELTSSEINASSSGATLFASKEFGAVHSVNEDKALASTTTISIKNMLFGAGAGTTTTIHAGRTVTFVNNDTVDHAATADDNSWGTGTLHTGDTFVKLFSTPGTYTYYCPLHPTMTGTIIVIAN